MNGFKIGEKILVTSDSWFVAPDGANYRAVWGTLRGVHDSTEMLGVRTNARSTNWYVEIGNVMLAGCQVHTAIRCDYANVGKYRTDDVYEGRPVEQNRLPIVYDADAGERAL